MIHIMINRKGNISLARQIYQSIKESIRNGTLIANTKLPSTRELASQLHVSRNSVIESYEQLLAEGYIYSVNGSGTYVKEGVILKNVIREDLLPELEPVTSSEHWISFRTGIPDLTQIPIKKWAQIYHGIALELKPEQMDYQDAFGDCSFRSVLANYLNVNRGTKIQPKNIIITNGAAQSFSLLGQLVLNNEYALVENPLSKGLLHTLEKNGVTVKPIDTDDNGLITTKLPINPPKLIFTTPSHQFPMGSILPIHRRIELINYANLHNVYIVEDDYDSEFRFDGAPIESMQCLAPERVIYVGTFSKTFMPALRIGYMVLPDVLCEKMKEAKYNSDIHSPILEQLTMAEFIRNGSFELHLRKMQKLYKKKRNHLIECLNRYFGEKVTILGAATGLHLVAQFEQVTFTKEILHRIREAGIELSAVEEYLIETKENRGTYENQLIFGYGNCEMEQMEKGMKELAGIIDMVNG